ncbi:hypothetical protein EFA46_008565 [Halarchaeum sp. CBA1220]|uniref:hypothetical protein n=1 Tax=Halarchaeum sp. CBA1220 TaxID=1853682 RepID=UPI000F3A9F1C|nr:hypothetical protein [Halarchaeum sp. CBA1220]QLC34254.1 hypothetical protein EFA46_008565 [Halarchaeum sp. CBA1220]
MAIPGPLAVARRLSGALVGRPRAALHPYLHESYSEDPTLFEEALTIASGAGSFALLSLCAVVALGAVACYALCYPVLVGLARLAGALRTRVGR